MIIVSNNLAEWNQKDDYFIVAGKAPDYLPLVFSATKDTVFLTGNHYIDLNLKTQVARLISRKDTAYEFKISSGNKNIPKGIETPSGLFTVQTKSPMAISKQFDNAELYWWISFAGNIGFHGLKGNGYYAGLGKRAQSHGCVRVSREDGEKLFKMVNKGTPVFSYENEPARIIVFAPQSMIPRSSDLVLRNNYREQNKILKQRTRSLYKGRAYQGKYQRIFLDGETVFKPGGYYSGQIEYVALRQEYSMGIYGEETKVDNCCKVNDYLRPMLMKWKNNSKGKI